MNIPAEFDEIRPYAPEELPQVFEELIADPMFKAVVGQVMPGIPFDMIAAQMRQCKTNLDFQKAFFYRLLKDLVQKCAKGLVFDCSAIKDKSINYTFISNHRDIVLDSALLSVVLIENGMNTVEIAIGDNLLIYPWIKKIVRINKSFIVKRGLGLREQLKSSMLMSSYMHYAISQKHENIWIAQRQGRAKDSNDRTQDSILKMMVMGGEGDIFDRLKEMSLVPLSLSYEFDPCDYLKAKEAQQKRDDANFKKSEADDLTNMQIGIFGYKGHIHFQTAACINDELDEIKSRNLPKTEVFTVIAELIDKHIHQNYHLYPCNYIAMDALNGDNKFADKYTEEDKAQFEGYLAKQMEKIDLPNKDMDFLRHYMLTMYANPAINHLKAIKA
ncbi:MAG: acyltransferase [Bacteroidaceae bacterium]|nr:acyltransferase [Bacteroidaceae bacterium]